MGEKGAASGGVALVQSEAPYPLSSRYRIRIALARAGVRRSCAVERIQRICEAKQFNLVIL